MSSAQTSTRDFVDTPFARILSALIAIGIAVLLFMNWGTEIKQFAAGGAPEVNELPVGATSTEATAAINPELASCLEKRIGDVDKMKADGVLSDAQYASFRDRAESLCRQTIPN